MADQQLIDAWTTHLREELSHHRAELGLAEQVTQAVVDRHYEALTALAERQVAQAATGRELRLRRERVLAACAARGAGDGSIGAVLSDAEPEQRDTLDHLRHTVREIAGRLRRCLDRNQMLMRTSLGLINDTLSVVTGAQRAGSTYGPRGRGPGAPTGTGGLMHATA